MRNSSSGHPAFSRLSRLPRSQSLHAANYIHGNWIDEELRKAGIGFLEKKGSKRWGSVLVSISFLPPVSSYLSFTWWQCGRILCESEYALLTHFTVSYVAVWNALQCLKCLGGDKMRKMLVEIWFSPSGVDWAYEFWKKKKWWWCARIHHL